MNVGNKVELSRPTPASPTHRNPTGAQMTRTAPDRALTAILRTLAGPVFAMMTFGGFACADAGMKWLTDRQGLPLPASLLLSSCFAFLPVMAYISATDGWRTVIPRLPLATALRGFLVSASAVCVLYALSIGLPLADAYVFVFMAPIFAALFAIVFLGEHVNIRQWAAIGIGFVGVLVASRPGFESIGIGQVAALMSAVMFALSAIVVRRIGDREHTGALIVGPLVAALLLLAPLAAFDLRFPTGIQWAVVVLCGTFAGTAQVCLVLALRVAAPQVVMPFQYTQMLWGILLGIVIFGEHPGVFLLGGAALVSAAGLWLLLQEARPGLTPAAGSPTAAQAQPPRPE